MRLDERSTLVRLPRRAKLESSSRCVMRPVPVLILDEFNRINISDIKIERRFDVSMSSLSSSKYMIELIEYIVVVVV